MKIQAVVGVVLGTIVVAGAAYAQMRPAGAPLDTYTFPDGTEVRTALLGSANSNNINVIQIKKSNGDECYGISGGSGQYSSIACLP